jgi:hypothetical protein
VTPYAASKRHELTGDQILILDFLDRKTPSCYAYNLHSARVIAASVGCTVRTVRNALDRLRELDLVARVTGAALRRLRELWGWRSGIRSATVLLWRAPREGEKLGAYEGEKLVPKPGAPPDPPIRKGLIEDEGLRRPSPSSGSPETGEGKGPEGEGETPPAPPEVLAAAAAAFGTGPVIEAKARAAAAAYPAAWVLEAIRIAAAKLKPWKYARGVLQNFGREGGPEPELPAAAARRAADARIEAERQERLARMRAAPEPEGKPDEETMGYFRAIAADPRHPWCERAKRDLAKWTVSVPADSVTPVVPEDTSGDC